MLIKFDIDFGGVNFPLPFKRRDKVYVGFTAVFAGCGRAGAGSPCCDCQNPSLWLGLEWDGTTHDWVKDFVEKKYKTLLSVNPGIEFFYCVLGGEPLDQDERELEIVHNHVMSGCGRKIPTVLFTGYDSWQSSSYVRNFVDYVKLGEYLGNDYRKENLPSGLATENQRWEKVTKNADKHYKFL